MLFRSVMETRTRSAISKGDRLLHIERYQRLLSSYQFYIYGLLLFLLLLIIYWVNKRYRYYNKIHTLTLKKDSLECQLKAFSVIQEDLRKKEQELKLLQEFVGTAEEDKAKLYCLTNQVNTLKKENQDFFMKLLEGTKVISYCCTWFKRKKKTINIESPFPKKIGIYYCKILITFLMVLLTG